MAASSRKFLYGVLLSIALSGPLYGQSPKQTGLPGQNVSAAESDDAGEVPEANPARPTVTNPAQLPPTGYLQFEQGFLIATATPDEVARQVSIVQTTKLAVSSRLMVQLFSQPFAATRSDDAAGSPSQHDTGDLVLGAQGVLLTGTNSRPTVALGYNRRVRSGTAPDLDLGSFAQSAEVLVSGDIRALHYDTNFGAAQQQEDLRAELCVEPNTANRCRSPPRSFVDALKTSCS